MIVACVITGALVLTLITAVALLRRRRADRLDYGDSCLDSWTPTSTWERRCEQSLAASRRRREADRAR